MNGHGLLQKLEKVEWGITARTYGSSHATLIGLLAHWWIKQEPGTHTVLDGGPSYGGAQPGEESARGVCDLLLCDKGKPVGVVEVEGSRPKKTWV